MKQEQRALFETIHAFRRLNISEMLPNIAHGDYGVLKMIDYCNRHAEAETGVKVSHVAQRMELPVPAVSRSLRTLEERGLIQRTVNRSDRRTTYVAVTDSGKALLAEADSILSDFADAVFGQLGDDLLRELNRYLGIMLETAKEEIRHRKYQEKKGEKSETHF